MNSAILSGFASPRLAVVFLAAFLAGPILARLARSIGWGDAPTQARKLQHEPVPTVGGMALLVALALGPTQGEASLNPWLDPARAPWAVGLALTAAFLVGALDDRFAFSPGRKAGLQLLALLPLLAARGAGTGVSPVLDGGMLLFLGFAALNLLNTFDNADGAVLGISTSGSLFASPLLFAACAGLLPWNLDARRKGRRAARAPTLYLGDAGVNVLALLVFAHLPAWPILWIPLLDLCRLSWVRTREGSRPWLGDRRHLAHRLQSAGASPAEVALVLALLSLPGSIGWALEGMWAGSGPAGLVVGALGFGLLLRRTPEVPARRSNAGGEEVARAGPCSTRTTLE